MKRGSRPRATARPHREDSCEHVLYPVGGVVRPLETTGPNKPSRSHVTVPIACLSRAFGLVRTVHKSTGGSGCIAPSHTQRLRSESTKLIAKLSHADSDLSSFSCRYLQHSGSSAMRYLRIGTTNAYSLRYPMRHYPSMVTSLVQHSPTLNRMFGVKRKKKSVTPWYVTPVE